MVFYSWIARRDYILGEEINVQAYDDGNNGLAKRIAMVLAEQLFDDGVVLELTGEGFGIQNEKGHYTLRGILTARNHIVYARNGATEKN